MLIVITDLKNYAWLNYLLQEFRRVNSAEFEIKVTGANEPESRNVIYYNQSFSHGITFPNLSDKQPAGDVSFVNKDVFIIEGTQTPDHRFAIGYDLFWNAFVFLSRLEEWLTEKGGKKISSYSFNHPRKNKDTFAIPIVNNLFDELENLLCKNFPDLKFGSSKKSIVDWSHDLDYITKTAKLRFKQTVFNSYNTLKTIANPPKFFKKAVSTASFLFSNPSYWCFDYWEHLEKSHQVRSTYYVYAHTPERKKMRSWLIDPSYEVAKNEKLQKKLKNLYDEGFSIGLHGGYDSALDKKKLTREKETLERAVGTTVKKTRQHWLHFEEAQTPFFHEHLFESDSTIGWNDRSGFRAGIASAYCPFNHVEGRAFVHTEIPFVLMDSHIYDYGSISEAEAIALLNSLKKYKNAEVSICWHARTCSSDYNWHYGYEKILKTFAQ